MGDTLRADLLGGEVCRNTALDGIDDRASVRGRENLSELLRVHGVEDVAPLEAAVGTECLTLLLWNGSDVRRTTPFVSDPQVGVAEP